MTDVPITEETILKRYESLPDDLKEALIGIGTASAIYEIGRKVNLNVEKIGELAREVGLIILGFVPSANFISDLKTVLEVNEEKAAEIAQEVNERLFLPIRESLKRIHGSAWAEGLLRPPARFEPRVAPKLPTPPIPARVPEKITPPEVQKPKEPLIIKPLDTPPSLPAEAGFGRTSPEVMPAERGQRPPVGRESGQPRPATLPSSAGTPTARPTPGPLGVARPPLEIRPPGLPPPPLPQTPTPRPPMTPIVKVPPPTLPVAAENLPLPPPSRAGFTPPSRPTPPPPPVRLPGHDPYREPVE